MAAGGGERWGWRSAAAVASPMLGAASAEKARRRAGRGLKGEGWWGNGDELCRERKARAIDVDAGIRARYCICMQRENAIKFIFFKNKFEGDACEAIRKQNPIGRVRWTCRFVFGMK